MRLTGRWLPLASPLLPGLLLGLLLGLSPGASGLHAQPAANPAASATNRAIADAAAADAAIASAEQATAAQAVAAHARWRPELDALAAADRERMPPTEGVVFVGSSTIRLWPHLAQDFSQVPGVIQRGVGGSTLAECSVLAHQLVGQYRPRQVVVYAGDNDLIEGHTPLQVLHSFARFANAVRAEAPDARITFVSVKPSPSREKVMPQIRETNNIVSAYLRTLTNSDYVDVFTPMLGPDGRPRAELFRADLLHMNASGYALWQSLIASHLVPPASASSMLPKLPMEAAPAR